MWNGLFRRRITLIIHQQNSILKTPSWCRERLQKGILAGRETFNLPIILNNLWQSVASPYTKEAGKAAKLQNKDFFFKSALLILMVSTDAFYSTKLFCCFFHVTMHQPIA